MTQKKKKPNKKTGVKRKKEMRLYALWSALPISFRELGPAKLRSLGYEVDDEIFRKLLEIRTKTQFAEEMKIGRKTLDRWEETDEFKNLVKEFSDMHNVQKFKNDIDFNFTIQTMKKADPGRVKLWYQLYQKWVEESRVGLSPELQKALETLNKIIDE